MRTAGAPKILAEILRSRELVGGVAEHGCGAAGVTIGVDEGFAFDVVVTLPVDRKGSVGFLDVERFGVTLAGEPERQVIVAVDDPGVAGFGGEQRELTEGDDAPIVLGGAALDVAARRTLAPSTMRWPGPRLLDRFLRGIAGLANGSVHQIVRRSLGLCLSLLRSHCHSWQAVTLREAMKLATAVKELGWREPKSIAPQSN